MISLDIKLEGDGAWQDAKIFFHTNHGQVRVALMKGGMVSGKHSVAFGIETPDGWVIAETSLELFLAAAAACKGRAEFDNAK